jgi:hypothetical protein
VAAVEAGVAAMMKQTNSAGKRLGLKPRYLLAPPDLLFTAKAICESERRSGTDTNDANGLRGLLEPVVAPQLTDPTDWYLVCDPRESETIEVGFVEGREEPELLMQDGTAGGSGAEVTFTQDVIRFKVRWGFGAGWIDYRGAYWGQVAG